MWYLILPLDRPTHIWTAKSGGVQINTVQPNAKTITFADLWRRISYKWCSGVRDFRDAAIDADPTRDDGVMERSADKTVTTDPWPRTHGCSPVSCKGLLASRLHPRPLAWHCLRDASWEISAPVYPSAFGTAFVICPSVSRSAHSLNKSNNSKSPKSYGLWRTRYHQFYPQP